MPVAIKCPKCQGDKVIRWGSGWANGQKLQKLRCDNCGHIFKGLPVEAKKPEAPKPKEEPTPQEPDDSLIVLVCPDCGEKLEKQGFRTLYNGEKKRKYYCKKCKKTKYTPKEVKYDIWLKEHPAK